MSKKQPGVINDTATQIKSRHQAGLRRRLIQIGIPVLVAILIIGTVWALWFSNLFVARTITVVGNNRVNRDEIVSAAEIKLGTPLMRLNLNAASDRVSQIPVVADTKAGWSFSGVVSIEITERQAVYVIPTSGKYLLVDATGVGFLLVDKPEAGLPEVNLVQDESRQSQRMMVDAAVIVVALPQSVRSKMTSMIAVTPDGFTIHLKNGAEILWGSCEQSDLKAEVIDGLLKTKANHYDISSPSHPATR